MKGLIANKIDVFNGNRAVMLYLYYRWWGARSAGSIGNQWVEITGDSGIILCGCCGNGNIRFIAGYGALVIIC
jgi:hypothetical protein